MDDSVDSLLSVHQKIVFPAVRRKYPTLTLVRGDNGNQETFREEIVRKPHNLIWDFWGTCLRPCKKY